MLSEKLKQLLIDNNMSKEELAEKCNLPYETVRNIYYGKTTDPKISTVMRIANAFNISVNCLMGKCEHTFEERALLRYYRSCGKHGKSLILLTAKYESLTAKEERESTEKHTIPCINPRGEVYHGFTYEECETREIYTTNSEAYVAIKISANCFIPIYCKGDIILISDRFPNNKEYGVFYKNNRVYIRQYIEEENQYRLKCLHNKDKDMIYKRMDDIEYIGTCCGVVRA
jgi:transcriptional regulator with XRE-family HTH domain